MKTHPASNEAHDRVRSTIKAAARLLLDPRCSAEEAEAARALIDRAVRAELGAFMPGPPHPDFVATYIAVNPGADGSHAVLSFEF